jgi:hypothetical protein
MTTHFVGDAHAGGKPRLVVFRALAFEQPADLVQLADVGAAETAAPEHVHEGGGPAVVAGKIHEVLGHLRHTRLSSRQVVARMEREARNPGAIVPHFAIVQAGTAVPAFRASRSMRATAPRLCGVSPEDRRNPFS